MLLASGIFKLACAPVSGWIRRLVPRAGLLGSLTAIALVIISFLPLLDIAAQPVAGFVALGLILATLTARWELPGQFPGALAAVVVGCLVYYAMHWLGLGPAAGGRGASAVGGAPGRPADAGRGLAGPGSRPSWREALGYLPVAIPLALATVVGGIDCTESAAAAGDDYPTGPDHRRRRAGDARRRPLRRRDPVDALHRPPRLQGDGGPRRPTRWRRPCSSGRRGSSATSTGSSS